MLLCAPTVKLLVFQQRRTFTSSLAKRFSFNAQSLTESQAQAALDKDCIDFLPWLEQVAGAKITNTLSIGKSPHGREVKSATGKGIPQSLRAFARLLSCTSPQELNDLSKEAEQNDGRLARLPFKDRSRELEAHKIILAHINSLIVDHSVCIKELGASNFRFESQRLTVRRQMARELIFGELRVLRSAAEWLIHYCTNLFSAP
ncbi:hypothetical protein F2Q68_00041548 [Brassica cretica]|uniref:Rubisco LSMT substrate-binding domain-containing protein n=1 Tax=Brassica cretica TaxID=69181 RepID=A0A8S9MFL9_BRACR|nr:hypothetical protein F2Q68_00041548 [Brassica cretica]